MESEYTQYLDELDDDGEASQLIDRGGRFTETIDLRSLVLEIDASLESPEPVGVESTAFGKLLEALPIPAFLIDHSRNISFANQSCEKISDRYKSILSKPFSSLFSYSDAAREAAALVDVVFSTRKTQVIEAVMQIEDKKIWARAHIRSLRWGRQQSTLVMVEDLTLERRQIALQKRIGKELEKRVQERTADLERTNERLKWEITERKRAEKEMEESDTRYRALTGNFPNGCIFLFDRDLCHMVADGLGLQTIGLSKSETEGRTIRDTYPREVVSALEPRVKAALAGQDTVFELAFKDRILEGRSLPIRNDQGEVAAAMVVLQDITKRKHAEEELMRVRQHLEETVAERTGELITTIKRLKREVKERKQAEKSQRTIEARFNVAFRANPHAVSIVTLDEGRFLEVNDSFCRITGHERDSVIGRTELDLALWARPNHRQEMVRILNEKGALQDYEVVMRRKDGKIRVASLSAEVIELDGERYILCISTDITERKRAEADYKRLTTAIEQAAESILVVDSAGRIRYANPAFQMVSGFGRDEIHGKNISFIRSPENDQAVMAEAKSRLKEGQSWKGTLVNRRKNDTKYQVETTISPVKGAGRKPVSFVIVERDVTGEVHLEEQLRQAQKMEAVGTLAGGIAHDFNNILMAMLGYTHLAKERLPENNPVIKDLDEVLRAGERARDLIRQILTFSRQTEQERSAVEVGLVVKEALRLLRASIPSTIEIRQEVDSEAGSVLADPTQIHQIVMNLCTNAFQAMEGDHGILTVSVASETIGEEDVTTRHPELDPGPYVRVTVSDTGRGIPREAIERIFDPYFTTKERGKGTGMGLAVVHGIISSHGGDISVYSREGEGTTFKVYLPSCAPIEQAVEEAAAPMEGGTERLLLVDDEQQVAEMMRRLLTARGYQVTVLASPVEALSAFCAHPEGFDLVITDLTMPNLTGLELARAILALRRELPVILCTGFGEAVTSEKAAEIGIREILEKPVTPAALLGSVRNALSQESSGSWTL
ncbi:MAG: PAS domain S-box protein [Pseudomonadota bacterium]